MGDLRQGVRALLARAVQWRFGAGWWAGEIQLPFFAARDDVDAQASRIQSEAQAGMDKQQREYFLREQLRAIQKELGDGSSEEALATEIRESDPYTE